MSGNLKPCPFCGGRNLGISYGDIDGWIAHVECLDCDEVRGPMSEYKYDDKPEAADDASNRWNNRPDVVEEILGLLTAHELYRYRPKAFQGFIDHVRDRFSSPTPSPEESAIRAAEER